MLKISQIFQDHLLIDLQLVILQFLLIQVHHNHLLRVFIFLILPFLIFIFPIFLIILLFFFGLELLYHHYHHCLYHFFHDHLKCHPNLFSFSFYLFPPFLLILFLIFLFLLISIFLLTPFLHLMTTHADPFHPFLSFLLHLPLFLYSNLQFSNHFQ